MRFEWVSGLVWAKKRLFWGTKCAVLGGHLPTSRPRPGAPPVSFWLKTWIWQGHHLGNRMARVVVGHTKCPKAHDNDDRWLLHTMALYMEANNAVGWAQVSRRAPRGMATSSKAAASSGFKWH